MKLFVDLETLALIEAPGFRNPVTALRFKRGDAARLEVAFLRDGTTPATIGDPAALELRFGVKPRGRYDVGYLVHTADWTMPAPGATSPAYECTPSFNTTELDSALGVGSFSGTELAEVTLMGEITWREGAAEPTSTRTFAVIVENDVNRGTEGVPESAEPPYPAPESLVTTQTIGDRAVRHDMAQTLTPTQRIQALANLGLDGAQVAAGEEYYLRTSATPATGVRGDPGHPFATIAEIVAAIPASNGAKFATIVLLDPPVEAPSPLSIHSVDFATLNNTSLRFELATAPRSIYDIALYLPKAAHRISIRHGGNLMGTTVSAALFGRRGIDVSFFEEDFQTQYANFRDCVASLRVEGFSEFTGMVETYGGSTVRIFARDLDAFGLVSLGFYLAISPSVLKLNLQDIGSLVNNSDTNAGAGEVSLQITCNMGSCSWDHIDVNMLNCQKIAAMDFVAINGYEVAAEFCSALDFGTVYDNLLGWGQRNSVFIPNY